MRPGTMKALAYLLIAAAGCWILSEILEIIAGRPGAAIRPPAPFEDSRSS